MRDMLFSLFLRAAFYLLYDSFFAYACFFAFLFARIVMLLRCVFLSRARRAPGYGGGARARTEQAAYSSLNAHTACPSGDSSHAVLLHFASFSLELGSGQWAGSVQAVPPFLSPCLPLSLSLSMKNLKGCVLSAGSSWETGTSPLPSFLVQAP